MGNLDGLDEYDVRRPMTPTGTNLLGLVKHVASVELDYFGVVFGRPSGGALPWLADDAEPEADLWATPQETRDRTVDLHRFSAAHSDATVEALPLDDILRELVDGAIGNGRGDPNIPERSSEEWAGHRARVEAAARRFRVG